MRGAGQSDGFTELESFSLGGDAVVAADDERVLLGTPAGRLEIRTADGDSETLDIDGGVEDLAIDGYVFVVADGAVTAYTTSGIELWSTAVTEPQRIVPLGREGVLACVTGDDRVVGIDTETGSELYSVGRPHGDVSADSTVVGGHGRVVIASWSFLVAFDASGDLLFDRNIEGAIEDVASLADGVVVRLKNGQLLRLDTDGDRQWAQATDASAIATYGDSAVLSVDGDGVSSLDEHGTATPLPVPAAESVLATGDGQLLVTTADRTQTVYRKGRPAEANLSATVETDAVGSGDRLRVTVANDGDERFDGSATLGVDPVDTLRLRRTDADLAVPEGGSTDLEFTVTEAVEAGDVSVELTVDGSTVGSGTVTVERRRDLAAAVDVSAAVESIDPDGIAVAVTATNTTESPVEVGVAAADRTVSVGADDTATVETTVDRSATTLPVTVSGDGETAELSVDIAVDGEPSLTVEAAGSRSNPYLDVVVTNGFDTTLSGTLSVDAGRMALDRPLSLEPSTTLRLAVLLTTDFVTDGLDVTATLEGFGVETATTVRESAWERRDADPTRAPNAGPPAAESGPVDADETEPADAEPAEPTLEVARATPESVRLGEQFSERIEVHNAGTAAAADVAVAVGDGSYSVGELAPEATVEVHRSHAVFEAGPYSLPAGRVTATGTGVELPGRTVRVDPADVEATVSATTASGRTTFEYVCRNLSEEPCRLLALGAKRPGSSAEGWKLDDVTVEPGDTAEFERTLEHDAELPAQIKAGCQYQFPGGDKETYWTLTQEGGTDGADDTPEEGVSVAVEAASVPLAGHNSAIDCTVTFAEALSGVTVEATGDIVSPLFVGERDLGDVEPGESVTQAVDILPDDDGAASFDLTVAGTGSEQSLERRYTVTGPVAAAESEAVEESWRAQSDAAGEPEPAAEEAGPTHLVTTFRS